MEFELFKALLKNSNSKLTKSDSYRTVTKYLKENNDSFDYYQLKYEKPYHVVTRNLHRTTNISFIKEELLSNGFTTKYYARHPQPTKLNKLIVLPIFFVNIEPFSMYVFMYDMYFCINKNITVT